MAEQYRTTYQKRPVHIRSLRGTLFLQDFLGSNASLNLGGDAIVAFPGSLTAAPLITLIAKKTIELGVSKIDLQKPARFYAPSELHIATNELTIGNIEFTVSPPADCTIFCNKLIFANPATAVATQTLLRSFLIGTPQIESRDSRLAPLFVFEEPDSRDDLQVESPAVNFTTHGPNTYT